MAVTSIRSGFPPLKPRWFLPAVLGAAVCLVALSAILLTRESGRIAAIWPSNALLLAVLLTRPRPEWRALITGGFLGNIAANALAGDPLTTAAMLACANALEVTIVAFLAGGRRRLRLMRRSGLIRFVSAAALGCLVSAAFAQLGFLVLGSQPSWEGAGLWLSADGLGLLIFTPLLMEIFDSGGSRTFEFSKTAIRELWLPLAALVVATAVTFSQTYLPLLFMPVAVLALLAASSGFAGAALGVVSVGAIILMTTPRGLGPISLIDGDLAVRVVFLQWYLLILTGLSMILGSISSERRRLIRRLTESRTARLEGDRRVRRLLDQSRLAEKMARVGYWTMDARTGDAFWSNEVYRIHGVEPDAFELTVEAALEFYDPEDRDQFRAAAQRCRTTGEGWEIDAVIVRRSDGEPRLTRCLAQAERARDGSVTGFFGVLKDLTEERAAAAAAAEQDRRYRLLADNASDVIALYGPDSLFRYVSPAVTELLGYQPEELVGHSTYDIIHPDDRTEVAEAFARASRDPGAAAIEYRACARDGSVRWLEARPRFKRDGDGKVIEIHDCVRDVSDRREREAALAAARQAAEEAVEAKSRFLATMSHEIRTPLHGVLGFTDVLARTDLTPDQTRYIDRIRSAGRGLAVLIDDILDFSRIEAGRMPMEAKPFNLRLLVSEVVELASATASHLSFSFEPAPDVEDWVRGDQLRVRQVLTNLVGNAAKFTPSGSVVVTLGQSEGRLRIRVIDDGVGLAPELQDKVFDLFVQADAAVGRKFGGAGLGLTISRSLARLMGGDITLENRSGQGVVACLDLPYEPASCPGTVAEVADTPGRPLHILVVDDADMNLELMQLLLKDAGHEVSTANSGLAAVRMVQEQGPFDLVLMDLQMPGVDGLAATRMIRELTGPASGTPIIALTAGALPETVKACREAGMDDHLPKPVPRNDLLARIDRLAAGDVPDPFETLRRRYRMRLSAEADELDRSFRGETLNAVSVREAAHRIAGTAGSLQFDRVALAARAACETIDRGEAEGPALIAGAFRALTEEMRKA